MSNFEQIQAEAFAVVTNREYVRNWFSGGAIMFFGESFVTGLIDGKYFM